jgi:hypothetical protein
MNVQLSNEDHAKLAELARERKELTAQTAAYLIREGLNAR